jgi:hypothetical protein
MGELIFGLNPVNTRAFFPGCAFSDTSADWAVQNTVTLAFQPCILEYLPMPGSLSSNALETAALRTHIRRVPVQDLLREFFALKTPEYASWSPQDKLCEGCLKRFMTDHIHLWLRQRKHAGKTFSYTIFSANNLYPQLEKPFPRTVGTCRLCTFC